MNHDDAMWNIMGQTFCSFKVKTRDEKTRFCRNPYNVTGLCQRGVCPLSNAQYATIIEHEDELYLYVKTAERAHLPRRQWEKVRLDASFPRALAQIDEELQWWDHKLVNKIKARLLRLKQYIMRRRKMLLEPKVEYVSVNKRQEDKLLRREEKAEAAARLELEVEKELLERLRKGTYDSVMNCSREAFERVLDQEEDRAELEALEDEEDEEFPEFVMDEEDEEEEESTAKNGVRVNGRKPARRQRLVIEEELEHEQPQKRSRVDELDW
ncbi:putative mak-16-like RNA binding protein [Trypanosoma rangeli]|uniref:Protein MAK16 homolog n=1 Tax=Trypanosoma rangeli TaxID=5698 RepID=A0A422N295_TRYRA|nr:putative mak-16-like RNA binding protein [Trypanosoma rangeli]RNE99592.1 putative mak-16-like RNA binding protein [Trypanosoma rangeli]|eukprot:RNE99592.1 putative mak-16-like RNA binding protein [Trypanosoma rangeli]